MSVIYGKNIKIYNGSGTKLLSGAKSCTIKKQADVIEKASSSNATTKEYIVERTSWSVDMSYLVTTGIDGIPLVGTTYTIKVMVGNDAVLQGSVICTECNIQATKGSLATGSIKMQGTGPLASPT